VLHGGQRLEIVCGPNALRPACTASGNTQAWLPASPCKLCLLWAPAPELAPKRLSPGPPSPRSFTVPDLADAGKMQALIARPFRLLHRLGTGMSRTDFLILCANLTGGASGDNTRCSSKDINKVASHSHTLDRQGLGSQASLFAPSRLGLADKTAVDDVAHSKDAAQHCAYRADHTQIGSCCVRGKATPVMPREAFDRLVSHLTRGM
jgi:hypothetical protein